MKKMMLLPALIFVVLAACTPSDPPSEPTLAPLSQVEMPATEESADMTPTSTALATATTVSLSRPTSTPIPTQQRSFSAPSPTIPCQVDFMWTDEYWVQAGDTLESIAQKIGRTTQEIMRANCLTSSNLVVGQVLRMPYKGDMQLVTYTVSPRSVVPNQVYTVTWEVKNAVRVSLRRDRWNTTVSTQGAPDMLDNLPISGTMQFAAGIDSFSEIIILVAYDSSGQWIRQDLVVSVSAPPAPAPEILFFAGSPEVMDAGGTVNLNWEVKGADHITLFPWNTPRRPSEWVGGVNVSSVGPYAFHFPPDYRDTSFGFTLRASSNAGQTAERDFIVQIRPVPLQLLSVRVEPAEAKPGDTVMISWDSSGSQDVRISDGNTSPSPQTIADNLPSSGSHPVTIPAHYTGQVTYIISAWDSTGINPAIQSVTVILR